MAVEPMDLSTAEHYKALAHPLRHRLLFELDRPATMSQLAARIATHKSNVDYHLGVLLHAGLVIAAGERQVRGGTERYYQRAARMMRTTGEGARSGLPVALQAVAEEIAAAQPEPLLTLRHLRLTASQAAEIAETLTRLAEDTEEADDDQPRYGMLVGLYQQLPPSATAADGDAD